MSDVPTPVSTALALPLATPAECGAMVVHAAAAGRAQLAAKKATRPTAAIDALLPPGGGHLGASIPRRRDFGPEGADGDAAHETAMHAFKLRCATTTCVR